MGVGRIIFGTLSVCLGLTVILGKLEEKKTARELVEYKRSLDPGPIPDLGVTPPRTVTKTLKGFKSTYDPGYLRTEELIQNLEDAEMRGMDDDPATLEDLRWELK